jgi:hypothetical protein
MGENIGKIKKKNWIKKIRLNPKSPKSESKGFSSSFEDDSDEDFEKSKNFIYF